MPRDMAVKGPDARVICVELNDHVRRLGGADGVLQEVYVPSLRVVGVRHVAVPNSCAFGEDVHVVAVQMHGMAPRGGVVVDDEADGCARAKVKDVVARREVSVAVLGVEQNRVVVVCAECAIIHVE